MGGRHVAFVRLWIVLESLYYGALLGRNLVRKWGPVHPSHSPH